MSGDEAKKAQEATETLLATIEVTTAMADLAAAMRDRLEERQFSSAVAEQTGVQFMFIVFGTFGPSAQPPKGGR